MNQRLRPCIRKNENAKIAKIFDVWKFNPAKVKAYKVYSNRFFVYLTLRSLPHLVHVKYPVH